MRHARRRDEGPAAAGPSPFYRSSVMGDSKESLRVRDARRRGAERVRRQRSWFRPLAVGLVAIVIASTADGHPAPGWHGTGAWLTLALIVWVAAVAAMLAPAAPPRVDPLAIALVGVSGVAIAGLQRRGATEIPASVTVWLAMTRLDPRRGVALSLVATVGVGVALALGHSSSASVLAAVLLCLLLGVMAHSMRQARENQDRAELLVAQLEDAREEQARAAAQAERARIAGELHDVLAHSLSGAAIQLQGARMLAEREQAPAGVREAIDRGSELVRAGLLEARSAVATLRGGDPPGARDLAALVQRFAGDMHVHAELRVEGEARPLGAQAELAVYRAAQEALTNAARYAPAADVLVALHYGEQTTALRVANRLSSAPAMTGVGGGHGLRGMRERVEGLGGQMSAGPRGEEWVVELELPR